VRSSRSVKATRRPSFRPRLEPLEDRFAPAVLNVTNTNDAGGGSLRAIIGAASSGDTINFTIQNATITLTSGEIAITQNNLTIDAGSQNITISGNNSSRIFDISGTTALTETVKNLIFTNGKAPGNNEPHPGLGGAIYDVGTLTLSNDKFNNSSANSNGGALYYTPFTGTAGSLTLDTDSFTSNTSVKSGGAAYAAGPTGTTVTVTSSIFTSNTVTGNADHTNYLGGGIYTTDKLSVTGGSFSSNSAFAGGGAIAYNPADGNSQLNLTNITFYNNSGESGAVDSNVDIDQGTVAVTVSGCLFNANKATGPSADASSIGGGGISVFHQTTGSGSASFTITNSTFYKNTSDYFGAGLSLVTNNNGTGTNTLSLTSLTVYQNTAGTKGGGLYINLLSVNPTKPQIHNSIIAGNTNDGVAADGIDVYGDVSSQGFNLIGVKDGSSGWIASDYKGTAANPLPAGLDPNGLADNGGPTQTIKLLTSSQGYRNGDPNLAGTTDQRGYTRQTGKVSIGAYDPDATAP
jgi:hypothetical protein